jgi:hypothetical protein
MRTKKQTAPDSILAQRDRANKQTDKTGNALQCIYANFHRHRERCLKAREEPAGASTKTPYTGLGACDRRRCLTRVHLRVFFFWGGAVYLYRHVPVGPGSYTLAVHQITFFLRQHLVETSWELLVILGNPGKL